MIRGYCRTNLDDYKREEWPDEFVAVPRVGEQVEAKSGTRLRVFAITHKFPHSIGGVSSCTEPWIEVELFR